MQSLEQKMTLMRERTWLHIANVEDLMSAFLKGGEGSQWEVMPQAPYVLQKEHKKVVCEWIRKLKFPDGYAPNLSRYVEVRNASLYNLKSHDCHVFMQRLLPLPFRDLLSTNV